MKKASKNRYINRSHISERKFRALLKTFCADITAQDTAILIGISRNTVNKLFTKLRYRLLAIAQNDGNFSGEVEIDESYFGAHRVRGKRGRGAAGKTPVFGVLKRNGHVYVEIVENCSKESLMPIIQGKILEGATVYTDGWKAYDGLILNGYDHYRVFHTKNEFARGKNHVNGIESFWSFAKRRLAKFNGLTDDHFFLHLKETEFRFNCRNKNFYRSLLLHLRQIPL